MLRFENRADARIAAVAEVYHRPFWIAYVANFALVMGNALMYRFAELVAFLGGSERAAGAIVGTGLMGIARCVRAAYSVAVSSTPDPHSRIAGWRWMGVR